MANIAGPKLIGDTFNHDGTVDFKSLFLLPCAAAVLAAVALAVFFRPPPKSQAQISGTPAPAH